MALGTQGIIGSLTFPYGTAARTMATLPLSNICAMSISGPVDWQDIYIDMPALGYGYEIWAQTAAQEQGTDIDNGLAFNNINVVRLVYNDLRALFIDFSAKSKSGSSYGTTFPTGDYGYCQFTYANGAQDMVHLDFQNVKVVPKFDLCTGANLYLPYAMSGTTTAFYNHAGKLQMLSSSGHPVSPSTNQMAGLGFGTGLTMENDQFTNYDSMAYPVRSVNNFSNVAATGQSFRDILTGLGSGPFQSGHMAYLMEAWQAIVQPTIGDNAFTNLLVTGENNPPITEHFIKSAKLTVTAPSPLPSRLQWRYGLPLLGFWAAKDETSFGPLHPINSLVSFVVPDWDYCNGLWVFLKLGCSGQLETFEVNNHIEGITNPDGSVRLADGLVDALDWI